MISVFRIEICLTYLILEVTAEMRPSRWESGIGSDLARFEDNGELATRGKYAVLCSVMSYSLQHHGL